MCLYADKGSAKTAEKDIACYKVVNMLDGDEWNGAYGYDARAFPFSVAVTLSNRGRASYDRFTGCTVVEGGYFHSCSDINICNDVCSDVKYKFLSGVMHRSTINLALCRCTIPAGTRYYEKDGLLASKTVVVHPPAGDPMFSVPKKMSRKARMNLLMQTCFI